jgi:hypothetical protein
MPSQFEGFALHISMTDAAFEFRRDGELLESLRAISLSIDKESSNNTVTASLSATAAPLVDGQPEATLGLKCEVDASSRAGKVRLNLKQAELSRWRPLVDALLQPAPIDQIAGLVNGEFEARFDPSRKAGEPDLATSGDLTVDALRVGGPLLSGYEVAATQILIRPTGRVGSASLTRERPSLDEALANASLDLGLEARELSIARDGSVIESFQAVKVAANKSIGAPRLRSMIELEGAAPPGSDRKTTLLCTLESDTTAKFTRGVLQIGGIEIARCRRFAESMVSTEDLSRAEGVLGGRLDFEADFGSARRIDLNGELAIESPRFTGALLQGADLQAPRFVLQPSIRVLAPDTDGVDRFDLGKTSLDLGFASLASLDAETRKQRGIKEGGALAFRADLVALAALGGPCASLAGTTGIAQGTLLLPKELFEGGVEGAIAQLRDTSKIQADAEVRGLSCSYKGFRVVDATASAKIADGMLTAGSTDGTRLNAGPLRFELRADTTKPQVPFDLTLGWKGGAVEGEAAELMRYFVPLLAGTSGKAADFRSVCDLNLSLQGFALRDGEENALQWLDRWTATGDITLANGRIVPAQSLQQMLALLDQPQELAVDRLGSAFTMKQGAISHRAMKWISKGKDYGLSGTVRLDGKMELAVDVTSALQHHKDGRAIAGFLGKQPLTASLGGTLDAPKFVAPDFGKLLQQALQAAPRQLLEQRGQDLLQEGLERLFGEKKKKVDPDKKQ